MKNIFICTIIIILFSFYTFAQKTIQSPCYREITQIDYNKIETNIIPLNTQELSKQNQLKTIPDLLKVNDSEVINNSKNGEKYIYVHLKDTYQRIADKGIKSIEIFQKLGDAYFFDGEFTNAAKWYGELFAMTPNVDSEYYDRYVYSLRILGKKDQANDIIKTQNLLYGNK